jgi:hypothetical protein
MAELQHGGGNGFRKPLSDRSPRGGLEPVSYRCRALLSRASDAAPGQTVNGY